jgi:predicted RNA-binding protein associated with RNAse of E/G family
MQQTNQSPEQIVKSMLQSGQISQDQFNRAAQMANAITGKK